MPQTAHELRRHHGDANPACSAFVQELASCTTEIFAAMACVPALLIPTMSLAQGVRTDERDGAPLALLSSGVHMQMQTLEASKTTTLAGAPNPLMGA